MPQKSKKKKASRRRPAPKRVPRVVKKVLPTRRASGRQTISSAGLESIGRAVGSLLAPGVGGPLGAAAGRGVSAVYQSIRGRGDYKVSSNTLVGSGPVPSFGDDSIRVTKREYLGDVFSSVDFALTKYPINPGNPKTFPWLSKIASNYEQYRIDGLVFEYNSTSAVALNSTNTALGKVVMATDYDALDSTFPDVRAMLATKFSNYGVPSSNLMHAIECKSSTVPTNILFVRTSPLVDGDIRMSDLGNFQFATEGMQEQSNIGGLWVSYDIVFMKPILGVAAASIPSQLFVLPGLSGGLFSGAFDVGPEPGFFPVELFNGSTSALVLPSAQLGEVYAIHLSCQQNSTNIFNSLAPVYSGFQSLITRGMPVGGAGSTYYHNADSTGGQTYMHFWFMLSVTALNPMITLTPTIPFDNGSTGRLFISMVNSYMSEVSNISDGVSPGPEELKVECKVPDYPVLVCSTGRDRGKIKGQFVDLMKTKIDRIMSLRPADSSVEVALASALVARSSLVPSRTPSKGRH